MGDGLALGEGPCFAPASAHRLQRPGGRRIGEPPIGDRLRQVRQLARFVAVEALVDHLLEAADQRPHHLRRGALTTGNLVQLFDPEAFENVERSLDRRLRPPGRPRRPR